MDSKHSWADQIEDGEEGLESPREEYDAKSGIKTVTEYKHNDDGKKVKVVSTYKIETRRLAKTASTRKLWKKFGAASGDGPGPNPANTIISEDVHMQFMSAKDTGASPEADDSVFGKLKQGAKLVSCRYCKGDHWSKQCPHKDKLEAITEAIGGEKVDKAEGDPPRAKPGKYVPPSLRDGARRPGESMQSGRRDESATIRVTNLSEDTRESDLQELFRPFGSIQRIYLAKDKITQQSKGFAFINYHRREDAARAIAGVSGFGYDHLILNVEWAKPTVEA